MRSIKTLESGKLRGKRVLVRVDYNVPFQDGAITDVSRISASLPTLSYLLEQGATLLLLAHLGRPNGKVVESLRLKPIAAELARLLKQDVQVCSDCIGDAVKTALLQEPAPSVLLLENVRFYAEETQNDPAFAAQLAAHADVFVQDAFGAVHRAHSSTEAVARLLPAYAGLLVETEVMYLNKVVRAPQAPVVAIVGGSKVSTKMAILSYLLHRVDVLVIGGAMAFTFFKAQGLQVGRSLVEDAFQHEALALLERAQQEGKTVLLPVDVVVGDTPSADVGKTVSVTAIPPDAMGLDIGPASVAAIQEVCQSANTIVWNGPLGVFETPAFAQGTFAIADCLAASSATTIIGGGDSAAAIHVRGNAARMTHISTGGGACLEYFEGKELPGLRVLEEAG